MSLFDKVEPVFDDLSLDRTDILAIITTVVGTDCFSNNIPAVNN